MRRDEQIEGSVIDTQLSERQSRQSLKTRTQFEDIGSQEPPVSDDRIDFATLFELTLVLMSGSRPSSVAVKVPAGLSGRDRGRWVERLPAACVVFGFCQLCCRQENDEPDKKQRMLVQLRQHDCKEDVESQVRAVDCRSA